MDKRESNYNNQHQKRSFAYWLVENKKISIPLFIVWYVIICLWTYKLMQSNIIEKELQESQYNSQSIVFVKYRDIDGWYINLNNWYFYTLPDLWRGQYTNTNISDDTVKWIYYDVENKYMLINLDWTYYHYCDVSMSALDVFSPEYMYYNNKSPYDIYRSVFYEGNYDCRSVWTVPRYEKDYDCFVLEKMYHTFNYSILLIWFIVALILLFLVKELINRGIDKKDIVRSEERSGKYFIRDSNGKEHELMFRWKSSSISNIIPWAIGLTVILVIVFASLQYNTSILDNYFHDGCKNHLWIKEIMNRREMLNR